MSESSNPSPKVPETKEEDDSVIVWVASDGDVKMISKCIVQMYNEQYVEKGKEIRIRAIGAGAINQAIKSVILANGHLIKWSVVADIRPSFQDVSKTMTSVVMKLNFIKI